jgi:hypothetical protein
VPAESAGSAGAAEPVPPSPATGGTVEQLVEVLKKSNRTFFGTALARATFAVDGAKLVLTVGGNFEQARCEGRRSWIEETAQQVFGRRLSLDLRVEAPVVEVAQDQAVLEKARLKEQAMKSEVVQTMLDVFAAEIRDAEEIP